MKGIRKILAGIGFVFFPVGLAALIFCCCGGYDSSFNLLSLLAFPSPFIGIVLIILGLLSKEN